MQDICVIPPHRNIFSVFLEITQGVKCDCVSIMMLIFGNFSAAIWHTKCTISRIGIRSRINGFITNECAQGKPKVISQLYRDRRSGYLRMRPRVPFQGNP